MSSQNQFSQGQNVQASQNLRQTEFYHGSSQMNANGLSGLGGEHIKDQEFEQIIQGKQAEINYWIQKHAKMQKQAEDAEQKMNFISREYDKLRDQFIDLEGQLIESRIPLEKKIEDCAQTIESQKLHLDQLRDQYQKVQGELTAAQNQNSTIVQTNNELKDQISMLQANQNNAEEDHVKRAGRGTSNIYHSQQSPAQNHHHNHKIFQNHQFHQTPAAENHYSSDITKHQFEIIDRQNNEIEYQKQLLKEKDAWIVLLEQKLNQNERMNTQSNKGRSVFC